MPQNYIDRNSVYAAIVFALFSFFLVYNETDEFVGSFFAALIAGGLAWIAYVLLRWLYLSFKR